MVRCPEIFNKLLGGHAKSKPWNSRRMDWNSRKHQRHTSSFPNIVICISAREDTRKLWQVDISVIRSTPLNNCVQAFLFYPGITEDEVHLGTAHLSIQQLTILPGPGRWGKIDDEMTTGWGGWFLEPINSTTIVTNTGKFTSNKPLPSKLCFFRKHKKKEVSQFINKKRLIHTLHFLYSIV